MKRIEVSTEIGSLSVTYQKQKKVLVCLWRRFATKL